MIYSIVENKPTVLVGLDKEDAAHLASAQLKTSFKAILLPGTKEYEVTAINVIGAIQLPSGKQLHVQPKVSLPNIFKMLSEVENYDALFEDIAHFDADVGLFDALGQAFALELTRLFKSGLKQYYRSHEGTLETIKGRILFAESLRQSTTVRNKLVCRFHSLSLNNDLNRAVVTAASTLLASKCMSNQTRSSISASLQHLATGTVNSDFQVQEFDRITLDRSTEYYRRILHLSKMILQARSYRNTCGTMAFSGFLLDVADLFEKFVAKILIKCGRQFGVAIQAQARIHLDQTKMIPCKPDLLFKTNDYFVLGDTKYKDFSEQKFSNADIYQMLAYLLRYQSEHGYLIYPAYDPSDTSNKIVEIQSGAGIVRIFSRCVQLDNIESEICNLLKEISAHKRADVRFAG